jgi:hypothetical protein
VSDSGRHASCVRNGQEARRPASNHGEASPGTSTALNGAKVARVPSLEVNVRRSGMDPSASWSVCNLSCRGAELWRCQTGIPSCRAAISRRARISRPGRVASSECFTNLVALHFTNQRGVEQPDAADDRTATASRALERSQLIRVFDRPHQASEEARVEPPYGLSGQVHSGQKKSRRNRTSNPGGREYLSGSRPVDLTRRDEAQGERGEQGFVAPRRSTG